MKMRKRLSILVIFVLFLLPATLKIQGTTDIPIVFSVSFLTLNTVYERIQWSELIETQLPKIGIGVDINNITGWEEIAPRTWLYPLIEYD